MSTHACHFPTSPTLPRLPPVAPAIATQPTGVVVFGLSSCSDPGHHPCPLLSSIHSLYSLLDNPSKACPASRPRISISTPSPAFLLPRFPHISTFTLAYPLSQGLSCLLSRGSLNLPGETSSHPYHPLRVTRQLRSHHRSPPSEIHVSITLAA